MLMVMIFDDSGEVDFSRCRRYSFPEINRRFRFGSICALSAVCMDG